VLLLSEEEYESLLEAAAQEERKKSDLARLYVVRALKARNSSKNEEV
jgi:hypothetical protein